MQFSLFWGYISQFSPNFNTRPPLFTISGSIFNKMGAQVKRVLKGVTPTPFHTVGFLTVPTLGMFVHMNTFGLAQVISKINYLFSTYAQHFTLIKHLTTLNCILFGKMKYSLVEINLINTGMHGLHSCICGCFWTTFRYSPIRLAWFTIL